MISRSNGWLTVDPALQSRKNAFENKMRGDAHKVSLMSPSWMQTLFKADRGEIKKFKGRVLHEQNTRCEENRVLLADSKDPPRSVFSIGGLRHNMMKREDVEAHIRSLKNVTADPVRLIEWREDPGRQRFDKAVATKIG